MNLNYRLVLSLILIFSATCNNSLSAQAYLDHLNQAREIHKRILTLDSHTDTPLMLDRTGFNISEKNDIGKIDFPRMKHGGLDAVFFAVFLGQGESSPQAYDIAAKKALSIFDQLHKTLENNKEQAGMALTPKDAYLLKKEGKRAVFIGLENAYPIGLDLSITEKFYELGARYITLAHTRNNHFCDSSNDPEGPIHGGLSEQGRELVELMNRMGIMIDVSHISDAAFYEVIELTQTPVIASHSNARAVNKDPRNMDDDMIKAIAQNGGVIQLCFLYVKKMPPFPERDSARVAVREKFNNFQDLSDAQLALAREEWYAVNEKFPPELPTVSDLIDHLDHIVNLVGIDHVGIGSDFDGGGQLKDCYDVSQMHNLTAEMLLRGYTEKEIEKIWSGNFMRVFEANIAASVEGK